MRTRLEVAISTRAHRQLSETTERIADGSTVSSSPIRAMIEIARSFPIASAVRFRRKRPFGRILGNIGIEIVLQMRTALRSASCGSRCVPRGARVALGRVGEERHADFHGRRIGEFCLIATAALARVVGMPN